MGFMLASLAAAALALGQDRVGLHEFEKRALDPRGLAAEFSVNARGTAKAAYFRSGSERQKIKIEGIGVHEEFVQNSRGMIYVDHTNKIYEEFMPFGRLAAMPPAASALATYALSPLLQPDLYRLLVKEQGWKPVESQEGAWQLELSPRGDRFEVQIDATGSPGRASHTVATPDGTFDVQFSFTKFLGGEPGVEFSTEPPLGYVPMSVKPPVYQLAPGDRLSLDGLQSPAPQGLGDRRVVVLFTRPSCRPSAAGKDLWKEISNRCQKLGARFLEVTVGPEPGSMGTFHDRDGQIAKAFGLTETPALFALESSQAVATWYGYRKGEDEAVIKGLLGPWQSRVDD
jgi:hypothetical protein